MPAAAIAAIIWAYPGDDAGDGAVTNPPGNGRDATGAASLPAPASDIPGRSNLRHGAERVQTGAQPPVAASAPRGAIERRRPARSAGA